MIDGYPFVDLALARRLENIEAWAGAEIIDTRAQLHPGCGASWTQIGGSTAMFDGAGSPITKNVGLGLCGPIGTQTLEVIEAFFLSRKCDVHLELSPLVDAALLRLLQQRDYYLVTTTSVMFRPIRVDRPKRAGKSKLTTRLKQASENETWAALAAHGWGSKQQSPDPIFELSQAVAANQKAKTFFAELDGRPIATGTLWAANGAALLVGASTIPAHRNHGAQAALLEARLTCAAELGCDLAVMTAAPGSTSQRNGEKHGFRIAYTRIKMTRSRRLEE